MTKLKSQTQQAWGPVYVVRGLTDQITLASTSHRAAESHLSHHCCKWATCSRTNCRIPKVVYRTGQAGRRLHYPPGSGSQAICSISSNMCCSTTHGSSQTRAGVNGDAGMIAKTQEPTEWCVGMVVVPKTDNKVWICADLTKLNQSVRHERHPLPAVDQVLAQFAKANVLSKLNANLGFWQIPLLS